jgi:thioredoxin 1
MNEYTIEITATNFAQEVMEAAEPVLIDFWAPWCGPCRMIGPVLDELAPEYEGRVKVGKVNVDEEPELASIFQIRGIPALYALRGGEVVDVMVGWGGKQRLESAFEKLAALGLVEPAAVEGAAAAEEVASSGQEEA